MCKVKCVRALKDTLKQLKYCYSVKLEVKHSCQRFKQRYSVGFE